jgi:hypothetical protein
MAQESSRSEGSHTAEFPVDRHLTWAIALGLLAYYGLIIGGHHYSIDGMLMFQTAKQILFHGTLVLDPPVKWGLGGGATVSPYGLGLPLAYLPALAVQAPFACWIPNLTTIPYDAKHLFNPALLENLPYLLSSWVNPVIACATGALVFRLARSFALSRNWSVGAALAYGLASPAVAYARYDFSQPLAGLALTAALVLLRDVTNARRLLGIGLSLAVAILTRPEFVILAGWIVIGVMILTRRPYSIAMVAIPVALALALTLAINGMKYGSITASGYSPASNLFAPGNMFLGVSGLLAGPSQGVLVFFPLSWLAPFGLGRMIRGDGRSAFLWIGLLALALAFYASYVMWWGGVSWGPRFLLPLIPLLTVAATYWAATPGGIARTARRTLFWALFAVGVVISWNAILLDFVPFTTWLGQQGIRLDHSLDQFQLAASPLVSGWTFLGVGPVDLFWVRKASLGGGGMLVSETAVLVLLSILVWSASSISRLLCGMAPWRAAAQSRE